VRTAGRAMSAPWRDGTIPLAGVDVCCVTRPGGAVRTMADGRGNVAVSPTPRQVGDGWVLDAVFANGHAKTIKGFSTQSEAGEWPGSARHAQWLRDNRAGLEACAGVAVFTTLERSARVLELIALTLVELATHAFSHVKRTGLAASVTSAALGIVRASGLAFAFSASSALQQVRKPQRAAKRHGLAPRRGPVRRRGWIAIALLLTVVVIAVRARGTYQPTGSDLTARSQMTVVAKLAHAQPIDATDAPDPIALLLERLSAPSAEPAREADAAAEPAPPTDAPAQPRAPPPAQAIDGENEAAPPRHDAKPHSRPAIVGVWVPQPGPCSARTLREGVLPAVISTNGARAGETSCVFTQQKQTTEDWRMRANCSNPHESWTTNVRLSVKDDRLIWTSKRGTQVYTRCRSNI
jgi:hypothetical protein